ncbi:MAG TPA: LLM class flavin-dependent oxidoreductase [Actinophytocola sp.]|uniref:LLM class flavin-dependent oxidoreductase n=1 Tax=Actinophytocola sp. TaxID=1872138 RepID=UPI002DDD56A5|nr:LLM class flavin-dependent oxidoreductase [Actinophytocola sp.]HEV2778620.1 LLM class flavin-dependent oxidoreductase [Actinophytocola sp.]
MRLDIFSEIQNPRPWHGDHEHERLVQTIEQAKLADELGYGCWWQVEHHGAEEFSLSSAPELLLTAISQHTSRIRLGHAAVLAPGRFNHPIRAAERAATLDHLSRGRLEFGLTRSTIPEWRLFNIDPADVRAQTQQAFEMIPRMWTEDRFSYSSEFYKIKDVRIGPKPYQKPHPPLWQAASSPASFEDAGRRGVGVLGTTLWEALPRVRSMIELYRSAISQCSQPVGAFVNDRVAFFTFVHCADTDEEAMRNGAATAAAWYTVQAMTFFEAKEMFLETAARQQAMMDDLAGGGLTGEFLRAEAARGLSPNRAQICIGRILEGEHVPDDEIFDALSEQDSLIVGSPDTCRAKLRRYADLGIDRLMCFHQVGHLPHDAVLKSIRLVGELIGEFDQPRDHGGL